MHPLFAKADRLSGEVIRLDIGRRLSPAGPITENG